MTRCRWRSYRVRPSGRWLTAWLPGKRSLLSGRYWVAIEGGNHAQFGWYGPQQGDNPATVSREVQQQQVVASTLDLLARLEE